MSTSFAAILKIGYLAKTTEDIFSEEGMVEQRQAASRLFKNAKCVASLVEEKKPMNAAGQVNERMNRGSEEEKK